MHVEIFKYRQYHEESWCTEIRNAIQNNEEIQMQLHGCLYGKDGHFLTEVDIIIKSNGRTTAIIFGEEFGCAIHSSKKSLQKNDVFLWKN